jgi:predicted DCC family thiol-disulfide oxidoreductase YuxK
MTSTNSYIILFDGICNFCNYWVDFIIKRDKDKTLKFATLQSDAGKKIANQFSIVNKNIDSIIFIKGGNYFARSDAVLEIAKELKSVWKILYLLKVIPRHLRNFIYDLIAKYRYAIFGKRNSCRVPTSEEISRFII